MIAEDAAPEIEGAVGAVEEPWVAVEGPGKDGDPLLASRQGDHGLDGLAVFALEGPLEDGLAVVLVLEARRFRTDPADRRLGVASDLSPAILRPAQAIVEKPGIPLWAIAKIRLEPINEPLGIAKVRQ